MEPKKSLKIKLNLKDPDLSRSISRVLTNIARVGRLLHAYDSIRKESGQTKGKISIHASDILRSCVVLLHATLEDGLRSLLYFRIPSTKEVFDAIALDGINESGRPEKFFLGELHRFKGMKVEEIWDRSLRGHLARQSFNDIGDLKRAIKFIIPAAADSFESQVTSISGLVARRHHIVHNADLNENDGKAGHQFTRAISRKQVSDWQEAVISLFMGIMVNIMTEESGTGKAT